MKPQFANVFNVSVNDNRSECSLSFYHMYVQHNYTPQPKGLIDMPEKTVDEVASIMLTRDGAHALTRLLIQSFGNGRLRLDGTDWEYDFEGEDGEYLLSTLEKHHSGDSVLEAA